MDNQTLFYPEIHAALRIHKCYARLTEVENHYPPGFTHLHSPPPRDRYMVDENDPYLYYPDGSLYSNMPITTGNLFQMFDMCTVLHNPFRLIYSDHHEIYAQMDEIKNLVKK